MNRAGPSRASLTVNDRLQRPWRLLVVMAAILVLSACCLGPALYMESMVLAASSGSVRLVRATHVAGLSPDASGLGGVTPLGEAVASGHHDVARELLAMGADPDSAGWDAACAPVHLAVWRQDDRMLRILLDAGANPGAMDLGPSGTWPGKGVAGAQRRELAPATALHYAVWTGDSALAQELLRHGASPIVACGSGQSARDLAAQLGDDSMAVLLSGYPAKTTDELATEEEA
ncbi:MAG: hypothetical protein GF320_15135 [Armatimonadia bacterium]|nr:hypothetical protein [Armatimonadia bacterium]